MRISLGSDVGAGHGQDQAQVGDQTVVDPEHRRPCRAAADDRDTLAELGRVACGVLDSRCGRNGEGASDDARELDHSLNRSMSARTASAWAATSVTSYAFLDHPVRPDQVCVTAGVLVELLARGRG